MSLFIRNSGKDIFPFLINKMAVVLIEFIVTPHSLHQCSIFLISCWRISAISDIIEPDLHIEESSANREVEVEGFRVGKSFINILKSIGLRTQPCGIPLEGEKELERELSILT